jgi:hypothetical protein
MGIETELGMELSMYKSMKSKVLVELKTPKEKTFIVQAKGFIYIVGEEDQVEFDWITDSVFPTNTEYRQWFTRQKDRTPGGNMRYAAF